MISLDQCIQQTNESFEKYNNFFDLDSKIKETDDLGSEIKRIEDEIDVKTSEFSKNKEEISLVSETLGDAQKSLKENIEKREDLVKRNEHNENKKRGLVDLISDLEFQYNANKDKIIVLEKEIYDSTNKKKMLPKEKITGIKKNDQKLEIQKHMMSERLKSEEELRQDIQSKIHHIQESSDQSISLKNELVGKKNALHENIGELVSIINANKSELSKIQKDQEDHLKMIKSVDSNIKQIHKREVSENETRTKLKTSLKKAKDELSAIYKHTDEEILEMKNDIESKREIINIYSKRLHDNELKYIKNIEDEKSKKHELTDKLSKLHNTLKDLTVQKESKEEFIKTQSEELDKKRMTIRSLKSEIDKSNARVSELQKEISSLKKLEVEKNASIDALTIKLDTMEKTYVAKIRKTNEKEEEFRKIQEMNTSLVNTINEKENLIKETKERNNQLSKELTRSREELINANAFIRQYKTKLSDMENIERNLRDEIKEKESLLKNLSSDLSKKAEENNALEEKIMILNNDLKQKRDEINKFKYSIDILVNNGQSLFNDLSVQMKDYIYIIDNYIQEKLPEKENIFLKDLENVCNASKTNIEIKANEIIQEIEKLSEHEENELVNEYSNCLETLRQKCKRIELLELDLGNKIKNYEMFDICNVEKNNLINESYNFINEKRNQLVLFKTTISDIEKMNAKLKNMDITNYLQNINEKCSSIDKFKIKVESLMNNQNKILKGFFGSSEIKLFDKIQTLENNVFKLIVVMFIQFAGIVLMWIF